MRLIGNLSSEHETKIFCAFLNHHEIPASYEPFLEEGTQKQLFHIWIENEEDHIAAYEHFERFKENPSDYESDVIMQFKPKPFQPPPKKFGSNFSLNTKAKKTSFPFTVMLIGLCCVIFIANVLFAAQTAKQLGKAAIGIGYFPTQKELMFDYPKTFDALGSLLGKYPLDSIDDVKNQPVTVQVEFRRALAIPYWHGVYSYLATKGATSLKAPMFEKIGKGEVWRLFSPALLHSGILHILFNMIWIWILCKQMEERLPIWKICLFILITAIISNTAQYFMSGPFFVGISGVVAAMVGFIYVRQKIAPWEGYPLERSMIVFIFYFVLLILILQIALFIAQVLFNMQFNIMIANTAHIVGALTGMLLAKFPFFAMEKQ